MNPRPRVAVIIVSYNTCDWLRRCLASIPAAAGDLDHEVVVVDNDSSDGSPDMVESLYPKVRLIRSGENLGFARGVNLGAAHAGAEHVLLCNPDGELHPGAIAALVAFADTHPDHAVIGGRTVSPAGEVDPRSCWGAPTLWSVLCNALLLSTVFRRSRLFDPEALGGYGRDHERDVDIVSGCLLLMRRPEWIALGGFDERYFMYGEDADLCLRVRASGRRCAITPAATMVHAVGASSVRAGKLELLFKGRITLMHTHWSPARARLGVHLMLGGVLLRRAGEALRIKRSTAWTEMWARRSRWRGGYPATGPSPSRSASTAKR